MKQIIPLLSALLIATAAHAANLPPLIYNSTTGWFQPLSAGINLALPPLAASGSNVPSDSLVLQYFNSSGGSQSYSQNVNSSGVLAFTGTDTVANGKGYSFDGPIALASAPGSLALGSQTVTAGSLMRFDWLVGDGVYNLANEGAIWPSSAYAYTSVNRTFTSSTIPGQGSSGPLVSNFIFANNNGATANVVSLLPDCLVEQSGGSCFGINEIARSQNVSARLVGNEIDLGWAVGASDPGGSGGLFLNVFNITSNAPAIQLGEVGGGSWKNGLICAYVTGACLGASSNLAAAVSFIDGSQGTYSSSEIVLGTGASKSIEFGTGGFGISPILYGDGSNNLNVQMGSTATIFRNSSGATVATVTNAGVVTASGLVTSPVNISALPASPLRV